MAVTPCLLVKTTRESEADSLLATEWLKPPSHGRRVVFDGADRSVINGPFGVTGELVTEISDRGHEAGPRDARASELHESPFWAALAAKSSGVRCPKEGVRSERVRIPLSGLDLCPGVVQGQEPNACPDTRPGAVR